MIHSVEHVENFAKRLVESLGSIHNAPKCQDLRLDYIIDSSGHPWLHKITSIDFLEFMPASRYDSPSKAIYLGELKSEMKKDFHDSCFAGKKE